MIKRLMDIAFTAMLILLASPLLLLLAILIRASLGPPILFRQQRPGLHGRPFTLYKFRTMAECYDDNGNPLPDEQRISPMGQWLRRWSLDELPQLLNVVKGDLSLVGPRPLLMEYLPLYNREQARRHEVKPGITGWAQINGRNAVDWESRLAMDVWYVGHQSFWLDLKILAKTILMALKGEGISQPGHVTMEKFRGTKQ